jgi:hypothetical protein
MLWEWEVEETGFAVTLLGKRNKHCHMKTIPLMKINGPFLINYPMK